MRSLLREWKLWRQRKVGNRRQELRAYYLFAFTTLGRVMQRLQSYATHRVQRCAQKTRADLHRVTAMERRAMQAWRAALMGAGVKAGKRQAASCFEGYWLQRRTWIVWRCAVSRIQECRAAAGQKLAALAVVVFSSCVASALRDWKVSGCFPGDDRDSEAESQECVLVPATTCASLCLIASICV